MSVHLTNDQIIQELEKVSGQFTSFCNGIDKDLFFHQPPDKWSIAQNVKHLQTAASTTVLAFRLPKFIIRLYAGKPNRPSRTYDALVLKYQSKLANGGRAGGRFIPGKVGANTGKEKMLGTFSRSMSRLSNAIRKNWSEQQLDRYIAPHPLLGKITMRELCYFTIYHTLHHLDIIKARK